MKTEALTLTVTQICEICNGAIMKLMQAAEDCYGPERLEFERQADIISTLRDRFVTKARGE